MCLAMLWIVEEKIKGLTQAVHYVPNDFINILFAKNHIFQNFTIGVDP